jgi:hypothetical protein
MIDISVNYKYVKNIWGNTVDSSIIENNKLLCYLDQNIGKLQQTFPMIMGENWVIFSSIFPNDFYIHIEDEVDEQLLIELALKFS